MKPHLFLLPGALGVSTHYHRLAGQLQSHYHIHTPDYSGHGGTPISENAFTIEGCAREISKWIDDYCHDDAPVYVCGHSLGGYAALLACLRGENRIKAVMTVGTKFHWNPEFAQGEVKMLNPEFLLAKAPDFAADLQARHAAHDDADRWKLLLTMTADMMMDLGSNPPFNGETLSKINIPVKICVGDKDRMVTIDESTAAWKAIPGAQFCVLPATPHQVERVSAERLTFEIRSFFKA
jgi:pimeloyl-ACP methyl ester carboxylesterase